jgi:transcriptional regulator with GAF, ATPase, and Fis domain
LLAALRLSLPAASQYLGQPQDQDAHAAKKEGGAIVTLAEIRRASDRAALLAALDRHGWCVAKAARDLGVNRTYFYELARVCGIQLGANRGNDHWRALGH